MYLSVKLTPLQEFFFFKYFYRHAVNINCGAFLTGIIMIRHKCQIFFYKITTNILFLFLSSERNADNDLLQSESVNNACCGSKIIFWNFLNILL